MKSKHIAAFLIALGALPLTAQFRPKHQYALASGQVAHTLARTFAERGIQISESQVSLPATVITSIPEPILEVRTIESLGHLEANRAGEVSSAVKMNCRESACLPFYAIVTLSADTPSLDSRGFVAARLAPAVARPQREEIIIKAGTHATLLMEDASTHIQMSVVTLENGVMGHTIRVASPDHKQTYIAEVVSANVLKGSL